VRSARFVDGFSFKYSPRPGTAAAGETDVVPEAVKQQRIEALVSLLRAQTLEYHRKRVGETVEILVEGPSRHGEGQIMGRDPANRVVNVDAPRAPGAPGPEAGERVRVRLVEALPHSLIGEIEGAGGPTSPL